MNTQEVISKIKNNWATCHLKSEGIELINETAKFLNKKGIELDLLQELINWNNNPKN